MKKFAEFIARSVTRVLFHMVDALGFYLALWAYQRGYLFLACFGVAVGIGACMGSDRVLAEKDGAK